MLFRRKKFPDGKDRPSESYNQQEYYDTMDRLYMQEAAWVNGYVSLLERHLNDRIERCKKCPYRNKEGSGCNDEIPD